MAGTVSGGKNAAATNQRLYGKDFYKRIGAQGGKKGRTGGFYHAKHVLKNESFIKACGAKGGRISKRGKSKKNDA